MHPHRAWWLTSSSPNHRFLCHPLSRSQTHWDPFIRGVTWCFNCMTMRIGKYDWRRPRGFTRWWRRTACTWRCWLRTVKISVGRRMSMVLPFSALFFDFSFILWLLSFGFLRYILHLLYVSTNVPYIPLLLIFHTYKSHMASRLSHILWGSSYEGIWAITLDTILFQHKYKFILLLKQTTITKIRTFFFSFSSILFHIQCNHGVLPSSVRIWNKVVISHSSFHVLMSTIILCCIC